MLKLFEDNILPELENDVSIYDEEAKRNKESKYNQTIAENNSNIFLFDKAHIKLGNKAQYEVCDLFTLNKELIQIKRYEKGTASISHLFTQAKFYAEAFLIDANLRKNLKNFIVTSIEDKSSKNSNKNKDAFIELIPNERPKENEYTIVLCILTTNKMSLQDLLFMTLYSIVQTYKFLTERFNYNFKLIQRTIHKDINH